MNIFRLWNWILVIFALCLVFVLFNEAQASEWRLNTNLASKHLNQKDLKEFNPGIGLEYHVDKHYATVGYFKNSYKIDTYYAGLGVKFYEYDKVTLFAEAGVIDGYQDTELDTYVMASWGVRMGGEKHGLKAHWFPSGVIGLQIQRSF